MVSNLVEKIGKYHQNTEAIAAKKANSSNFFILPTVLQDHTALQLVEMLINQVWTN